MIDKALVLALGFELLYCDYTGLLKQEILIWGKICIAIYLETKV